MTDESDEYEYVDAESLFCCGVVEVHGLENSKSGKTFLESVAAEVVGLPAYIVFTATAKYTRKGQAVVDYIEENKLGSIIRVSKRPIINGNSYNKVHMWVWIPNKRKFQSMQRAAIASRTDDSSNWRPGMNRDWW